MKIKQLPQFPRFPLKLKFPKFNFSLPQRTQTRIGLDLGSHNLKVAVIEGKDGSFKLTHAIMKDIRQTKDIPAAINKIFKEADIRSKKINISISGENVVARYLSLPKLTDGELKKAMEFELEDHIPFKPDEVYTDYHILGEEPNSKNRMRVFLVATKKELLDERMKLIQEAGLEPVLVTTDALALKNTFYFNYPDKNDVNITLLNIGDKITNLLITREQIPFFVRDTRFGGEAITTLIQTKSQLDRNAAEELKYNLQKASADVSEIIKATLGNLLNEIFVSLDFYENLTEQSIDEIYITGGSSQIYGLKEFLSGYLNLKIFPLEPFKNFSLSPNIPREELVKLSPYLAIAIGLALEDLNG